MSEEKAGDAKKKVAPEMAAADFARWLDAMDLDLKEEMLSPTERKSKERVLKAITDGRLSIDEKGQPVLHRPNGDNVIFREPNGAAFMAMDGKGADAEVAKQFAFMAAVTEKDVVTFAKMPNRELNVCLALVALFLA